MPCSGPAMEIDHRSKNEKRQRHHTNPWLEQAPTSHKNRYPGQDKNQAPRRRGQLFRQNCRSGAPAQPTKKCHHQPTMLIVRFRVPRADQPAQNRTLGIGIEPSQPDKKECKDQSHGNPHSYFRCGSGGGAGRSFCCHILPHSGVFAGNQVREMAQCSGNEFMGFDVRGSADR